MRTIYTLILLAFLGIGSWWLWEHNTVVRGFLAEYVDGNQFLTLEARYTPDQIMEQHRQELLGDEQHSFKEPSLKFYPYILMEVKYSLADKKTREGVILWGLEDGEMVLNTETWETTHGFDDLITAGATRADFKVVNALASKGNASTHEDLQKALQIEGEILDDWLQSVRQKKLVVQRGNVYQLHFQNPKLLVPPTTKINQWLVTKPYNHAMKVSSRFNRSEIEKTAKAAFGNDFTVRSAKEVFLPIYSIGVLNPDGSVRTTHWNALNGKRINPRYYAGA
jgi:hypothetical protein